MMKKYLLSALLCMAVSVQADMKIATVDVDAALKGSPQVAKMQQSLEGAFKPRQSAITEKRAALKKSIDALKRNESVMKADTIKQQKTQIEADMKALQIMEAKFQQDVYAARADKLKNLQASFQDAVKVAANQAHVDLVLNQSAKLYSHDVLDLTSAVQKVLKKA